MRADGAVIAAGQRFLVSHHIHNVNGRSLSHGGEAHLDGCSIFSERVNRLGGRLRASEGVEGHIHAAASQFSDGLHSIDVTGVHDVGRSKFVGKFELVIEDVHSDDPACVHQLGALDGVETHAAAPKHRDSRPGLYDRRVYDRAYPRCDTATDQRSDIHWHFVGHGMAGLLGNDDALGENSQLRHLVDFSVAGM